MEINDWREKGFDEIGWFFCKWLVEMEKLGDFRYSYLIN